MSNEVELKFLVLMDSELNATEFSEKITDNITQLLQQEDLSFQYQLNKLTNCYFDTADQALRQLDFGLRIRRDGDHIEQTIKTAGVIIGGLHQRPEYNVKLANNLPDLALFPSNIWPETDLAERLQPQLVTLFHTDFTRSSWRVNFQTSIIDIVFDRGEISVLDQSEPICEIELEIVSGEISDLLSLAGLLCKCIKLRPSIASKAKRGYSLLSKTSKSFTPIDFDSVNYPDDLKYSKQLDKLATSLVFGVSVYLQQLQRSVDLYMQTNSLHSLLDIVKALRLLQHGFLLFSSELAEDFQQINADLSHFLALFAWLDNAIYLQELMNKTGNYRKKLDFSKALISQLKLEKKRFPDSETIIEILHSERFNRLQMRLVERVIQQGSLYCDQQQGADDLFSFAKAKLSASLTKLTQSIPQGTIAHAEQVLAIRQPLQTSLLTGYWFGSLFDKAQRQQFRMPWLDIEQGLSELQSLWIIDQQLQKLAEPVQKLVQWQHGKVDNLLTALDHSKNMALSIKPYWQG